MEEIEYFLGECCAHPIHRGQVGQAGSRHGAGGTEMLQKGALAASAHADNLIQRGYLVLTEEAGEVTERGASFLGDFGVDLATLRLKRRTLCRPCLDWTERRLHIGGTVGTALARRCFDLGWLIRSRDNRALAITPAGQRGLADVFGLSLDDEPPVALRTAS